jgi:DNA polymerase III delta prime subunit
MNLSNLNEIAVKAKEAFNKYHKEEILLSSEFKSEFSNLLKSNSNDLIRYSTYTSVIETSTGLTITFPNQWFYIASYFVPFVKQLRTYKEGYNYIFQGIADSKEIIKQIKETKVIPFHMVSKINNHYTDELDSLNFQKFLSDYDWWFGSKTIDRSDYYVSPILNLAAVVNVSQSYIADLAYLLSENDNLISALKNSSVKSDLSPKILSELIKEDNSIRDFALYVFKYFYGSNWKKLIDKCERKPSKINNKNFQSYDFEMFKRLFSSFDELQNKDGLTSANTQRYFEEPILILDSKYYYFTTQWNGGDEYDLSFKNLKNYFEEHFPSFQLMKAGKKYILTKNNEYSEGKFDYNLFVKDIKEVGLIFSPQLIQRFIASLCTKPFVICSGLSGSGKTKLAQAFAQWICYKEAEGEKNEQYCIVPVGADWTNREPLLGYPNALQESNYIKPENGVLDLINRARLNETKPYFLILDEMNLSHVERYFADFLSTMESGDAIPLHTIEDEENGIPKQINLPKNLFIIGTVNIDETTYMFSPKVLDRANTIEFRLTEKDLKEFIASNVKLDMDLLKGEGVGMGESFVAMATQKTDKNLKEVEEDLLKFFKELKKSGTEFGYRSASEMGRLMFMLKELDEKGDNLLDIAIMQKLLPKLHGSRNKLTKVLPVLGSFCLIDNSKIKEDYLDKFVSNSLTEVEFKADTNIKYKISFEKICRMYKNAIENGFASYAEA